MKHLKINSTKVFGINIITDKIPVYIVLITINQWEITLK